MRRFDGQTFIITGGARGQGAQQARQLVEGGARVAVTDLLDQEGRAVATELGEACVFVRHDVTDEDGWRRVIEAAERLGSLRGLVNNAGVYTPAPLFETDPGLVERHFRVNQLGTVLGMKHAAEAMTRSSGGSIVNISSTTGLRGIIHSTAYGGTKWAVRGMTKTAAIELAPFRIRVNSVHPGLIDTPMLDVRRGANLDERAKRIPLGRMGTARDVADLVLFLLSDESAYITGAEIAIDGGLSL